MQQGLPLSPSWDKRTLFTAATNGIDTARSLQRVVTGTGQFADAEDDSQDFSLQSPTPGIVPAVIASNSPFIPDTCGVLPEPPPAPSEPPSPPTDSGSGGESGTGTTAPPGDDTTPDPAPQPNTGLLALRITELLPNPAPPQTDANDEFIELYNSNAAPFDVSGFVLEVGTATKHRYIFPNNSILAASSWTAFYARDTGLSLSNTGGAARLFDPTGVVISATDTYGAAVEGQVWAYDAGTWQWSATATPGAANVMNAPPDIIKKIATTPARTKKMTAVKAATTATKTPKQPAVKPAKIPKQSKPSNTAFKPVATTSRNPLHTGVLATVAAFALLYGAYEYRSDIANKLHQLRRYRADRRKNRSRA